MKILHIDIETSPHRAYVWGMFKQDVSLSQLVESGKTICFSAKWHKKKPVFYSGINIMEEKEMIQHAWDLLDEADVVCHYNGTKFDIPTLNKEFLNHGLTPPSPYQQIDLLWTARKQFRLASNKLDYVAGYLGVGHKLQHKGMELWTGCMNGNKADWKVMERYNKQDVILLEKVYNILLPWIKGHPNYALFEDKGYPVCTNCGSKHIHSRGTYQTKTQFYKRFQCVDCKTWVRERFTAVPKEQRKNIITNCN